MEGAAGGVAAELPDGRVTRRATGLPARPELSPQTRSELQTGHAEVVPAWSHRSADGRCQSNTYTPAFGPQSASPCHTWKQNRGVWDAARPPGAGGGRDTCLPLSSPLLPISSRAEGGHAGGRRPDIGETGRQTHPSRLPTDDHQTRERNDRHYHLANHTRYYKHLHKDTPWSLRRDS